METITLYHYSPTIVTQILDENPDVYAGIDFGGVWGLTRAGAGMKHGDNLHVVELLEEEVLDSGTLIRLARENDIPEFLALNFREAHINSDELKNALYDAVVFENNSELLEILGLSDGEDWEARAMVGWECQRLRGLIAKKFGYKAAQCEDEFGTSYLINSAAKIQAAA